MRRVLAVFVVFAGSLGPIAHAAALHPEIDLSKFDDDLMKDLDKTNKYFEPDINGGNADGAADDAAIILDAYRWLGQFFADKGPNAENARQLAKQGQDAVNRATAAIAAKDFATAAAAAREVSKSCRTCHDEYKPDKAR